MRTLKCFLFNVMGEMQAVFLFFVIPSIKRKFAHYFTKIFYRNI